MRNAVILISILWLSGCVRFQPEPLTAVQTLSAFQERSLNSTELKEFLEKNLNRKLSEWPLKSWDFDELTSAALYYYPDMAVARARWKVAKAAIITAGGRPNPSVGFEPQYNFNAASAVSPWIFGVKFDIPIETMGKRRHRISQAKELADAAELNLRTTAWQIRSRLRASVVRHLAAKQTLSILKRQVVVQEDYVGFLEQGIVSRRAPRPDLLQAQISLTRSHAALVDAVRQVQETKIQIANALGLSSETFDDSIILFDNTFHPSEFNPEEIRKQALLSRPDILSALAEYAASQSSLQLEIAKQYPDIHIGPGYTWDQGQNKWAAGISVTLPVLNRNQGPIAEALARREEAKARFISLQTKAIDEIDHALTGYQSAIQKLETAETSLLEQKRQTRVLQSFLKTGEVVRLSLLNAELALNSAELSHVETMVQAQLALGLLEDAVERPLNS